MHQLGANALVFIFWIDAHAGHLGLALLGIEVQGNTRRRVAVHLEHIEILHLALDLGACPEQELIILHAGLEQGVDGAGVFLVSPPDGLVFIGVHQRADTLVGEDLGQESFLDPAVDQVHAGNAAAGRPDRVLQLGDRLVR